MIDGELSLSVSVFVGSILIYVLVVTSSLEIIG